jgi:anti-sigma B factor antagonist
MKISQREVNGVVIVELKGQLTMGEGDLELRDAIAKVLEAGHRNILIDLGRVSYLDSAGLGELIRCYTTSSNRGGKLKLLNLTKKTKDLLTITKLITVFDSYEDEKEAVASFAEES